jgi:hypothetical protein
VWVSGAASKLPPRIAHCVLHHTAPLIASFVSLPPRFVSELGSAPCTGFHTEVYSYTCIIPRSPRQLRIAAAPPSLRELPYVVAFQRSCDSIIGGFATIAGRVPVLCAPSTIGISPPHYYYSYLLFSNLALHTIVVIVGGGSLQELPRSVSFPLKL